MSSSSDSGSDSGDLFDYFNSSNSDDDALPCDVSTINLSNSTDNNNNQNTKIEVTNSDQHVFISYQWDAKNIVLRVKDRLNKEGIKTWIDVDDMTGSATDAMAFAVENASVVIVCLSQKYKDSVNCRAEADYAFRIHKPIIPLRLQAGYYPDEWLGLIVGSKVVLDVSIQNKYEDSMRKLMKELKNYNKHGEYYVQKIKQLKLKYGS